jgi:diguanylate cyclase (GGDEF)-like protein
LQVQTPLTLDGQIWMLVFEGFPRAYDRKVSFNWELFSILAICALFSLSAILVTVTRRSSLRLLRLTQELTDSNQRYEFLATHDALTKAANRVLFQSRLETTLAEAARYKRQFGLIYIDLDKFKPVNDVHGHHTGDLLLQSVTDRLAHLLRDSDLLARRGGDEFVVLLPLVDGNEAVETVAHKICTELATPFDLEGLTVHISGSLGLAIYPTDGETVEDLINQADSRMYAAKQRGGNRWVFL